MELQSLFITPVMIETSVTGHDHLIDRLYELKAKDAEGMPRSNVGGWHSSDDLYEDDDLEAVEGRFARQGDRHRLGVRRRSRGSRERVRPDERRLLFEFPLHEAR